MAMDPWLTTTLTGLASSPILLFAAIILLTFVQEDAVALSAGLLAGRMVIGPALAVTAVIVGTAVGDLALYAAGRWLSDTRAVMRLRAVTGSLEGRLRRHGLIALAIARFVPGTRLPVFLGSGVIRMPFLSSTLVIVATTLAWTPILFFLGFGAGEHVLAMLTPSTIAFAAAMIAAAWFAPKLIRLAANRWTAMPPRLAGA
jgi:membrane protein DedA with SNARE-associated domain